MSSCEQLSPVIDAGLPTDTREAWYYRMALIRRFEERILELFEQGELSGTTHACIGQEANAVAVMAPLRPDDVVVSHHRCHGHYLARTGDVEGLLAEMMGRAGGVCGGRGGSQHLCRDGFYTNGVLGSTAPLAAGMAYAEKCRGSGAIGVLFMGDGAFGEGTVYETLNLVSLWQVPLLIVVENNRYAQTTPLHMNLAGGLLERVTAFGLDAGEIDGDDVETLARRFERLVPLVRETGRPHVEIIHTYRLCGHSKGDDHRCPEELERWRARDPLAAQRRRLAPDRARLLDEAAADRIARAEETVRRMPPAE